MLLKPSFKALCPVEKPSVFVAFLFNKLVVVTLCVELQLASLMPEFRNVPNSSGSLLSTSVANDHKSKNNKNIT